MEGRKKKDIFMKKKSPQETNQSKQRNYLTVWKQLQILAFHYFLSFFFPFFPFLCFPLSSYMVINCPYHLPLELWRLESLFLSYDRHVVIMFPNNTWYSK